ncbi:MAG: peptidase MA family metallohydrolase [Chloroflexi bacterium]|nr:peptidase MA family metallohydrolase [Chloroflexota bacterium]
MRNFLFVTTLILFAGLAFSSSQVTHADEGNIQVVEATAESQFPDGIRFSVSANSVDVIDDIRVFFSKVDQQGRSSYRTVEFESGSSGSSVSGESILPSGNGAEYFPPGTKIDYSFEVRDKAGAVVRTESQEFVYQDNRFEWDTVVDGLITVYYYSEYVRNRAETVLEAAKQNLERMLPVLGIAPTEPLRIVSYNNYVHMAPALPFRSQEISEGLQTQGMAFSEERVLLVHGFDPTVTGTVSHEFTHLLVGEAAGPARSQVPAWLNEGLAEYGNIDPTDDYDAALRYGIFTRRIKPLWYQGSFGGTPEDIIIAYGQARSVVGYMIGVYGPDRMSALFPALQRTLDIDEALLEVYGMDQFGLDTAWREALGLEPLSSRENPESQASREGENSEGEAVEPTSAPEATPDTDTPPDGATGEGEEDTDGGSTSPGCSAPASGDSPAGLGMLLVLGAPIGLVALPRLRRRWPFS